ncbi:MAG: hypothetical protein IEMM0008_1190 [bacterium]|nr:MAG: hypothetical protein IEMM0008_1190 [bacterium]
MKRMLQLILVLSLAIGLSYCNTKGSADKKGSMNKSNLVLAKFHSDNCATCAAWDKSKPGYADFKAKAEGLGIKVIQFDSTSDETKAKSVELAAANKIKGVYDKFTPKTGFALLIDKEKGEVLAKISPKTLKTVDEQIEALKAKLN